MTTEAGMHMVQELTCPRCKHVQPEGEFCEKCGEKLSETSVGEIPGPDALEWWNLSPTTRAYWRGALRTRFPWVAGIIGAVLGSLLSSVSANGSSADIVSGALFTGALFLLLSVGSIAGMKRASERPGGVWRKLSIIMAVLGVILLVIGVIGLILDVSALLSLIYLAVLLFVVALVFLGVSWAVSQNAQRADREDRLQRTVKEWTGTNPATSPVGDTTTRGIADELAKLAQLAENGMLSEEEYAKAKAMLLRNDSSLGR